MRNKSFYNQKHQDYRRTPHRASAVLPSTGLPDPIRARAILGALATSPARYSLITGSVCLFSKDISQQRKNQSL